MLRFFGAKVRFLRARQELSQSELARRVGLARHTHINHIEAGRRTPSLELTLRITEVLGVTTDYLLRDDVPVETLVVTAVPGHWHASLELFSDRLRHLRIERGMTQTDLMQQLGLASQGYISKLESGNKEPSPDVVVRIADLFGVTTDDLLIVQEVNWSRSSRGTSSGGEDKFPTKK